MPPSRRVGSAPSASRTALLEAAEKILIDDGYAAVTSRRVAEAAGMHAGNVHYYFPTLDDLFIALVSRGADRNQERLHAALASSRPLAALWRMSADGRGVALLNELMAAANHRRALREHVVSLATQMRRTMLDALTTLLPQYGIDVETIPPELFVAMLQGTALSIAREALLGMATGHEAAGRAAAALIDQLEARRSG